MIKRVISMTLALMLIVACMAGITVSADGGYEAKLGYSTTGWDVSEWGENVKTTVTGDGTYTLSWDVNGAYDAGVFVIDIAGAQAVLDITNQTYNVTDLTITVDGNDVPVDLSKLITGDLEGNGNFRIEIYNLYGAGTADDSPIDPSLMVINENLTITFTIETIEKPAEGEGETASEWTAFLMFTDTAWAFGNWDATYASTTVTGAGSYSVTLNATDVGGDGTTGCAGINVFCVDITGANAALMENNQTFAVTDIKVIADGSEVTLDASKIGTGDIEENGNYRIELYNIYGVTAEDPAMDGENFTFANTLTVEFTLALVDAETGDPVETEPTEPPVVDFDNSAKYNAYLMLQTPNWTYRDAWWDTNGVGSDYWGQHIYGNETGETYGVVTDAVIDGNGTYSVKITDFGTIFADDFSAAGQDYFNIIGISTDIPFGADVQITDVKLIIDGQTRHTYASAFINEESGEYLQILVQNKWNDAVKEISYYPAPGTSLEIQFTISGFSYDNPEQSQVVEPEPTEPQATEPSGSDDQSSNMTGIIIAVVVVAVVAVVVVVVLKKKKA